MKPVKSRLFLALGIISAVLRLTAATSAGRENLWYEAEAAAGDPLVTVNRIALNFDHTEADAPREKFTLGAAWTLGRKTGVNDWALGVEIPVLLDRPDGGGGEEGLGDFKLRLTHTLVENETWLTGGYMDAEFDTAASNVQAIANQRSQLCAGTGFIRNLSGGWAFGAAVQYGWSLSEGETNGDRSEMEFRLGIRKKLTAAWSATGLYKGIVNIAGGGRYTSAFEPSVNWSVNPAGRFNVFFACEIPLESGRENFTGKTGLAWVF